MKAPLDELYLTWLYSQVADPKERRASKTYWGLLKELYIKKFLWFIPKDDNRCEDGRYLRNEFMAEEGIYNVDDNWLGLECSVLEMLIGLSRRLSFVDEREGEADAWFWRLLENLGLERYNDNSPPEDGYIEEVLNRLIFRTYHRTGRGGLFPLRHSRYDQTEREIWYQANDYVSELLQHS